ncbi:MAG: phosphopantetheine-binding protein [Mycoplasmataceae bacterium]|jgi:acyl carrier protein|nr:phosphopantetheine-binding protein [Mycoplasmataceae bacterium]
MNKDEIINQIKQIALKKNIKVNDSILSKPLKEIGIDSLSAMSLIIDVEDAFNITISDEKLTSIKTLSELVNLVFELKK